MPLGTMSLLPAPYNRDYCSSLPTAFRLVNLKGKEIQRDKYIGGFLMGLWANDLKVLQPIQIRRERSNNATRMCPFAVRNTELLPLSIANLESTNLHILLY